MSASKESMANDVLHLRDTLAHLYTTFGEDVRHGIVVVVTKPNLRTGKAGETRLQSIRKVMDEQGLSELVVWNGPEMDTMCLDALRLALSRAAWRLSAPVLNSDSDGARNLF